MKTFLFIYIDEMTKETIWEISTIVLSYTKKYVHCIKYHLYYLLNKLITNNEILLNVLLNLILININEKHGINKTQWKKCFKYVMKDKNNGYILLFQRQNVIYSFKGTKIHKNNKVKRAYKHEYSKIWFCII